ncbi:DUF2809 domain-containing protein [Acaryochloris sp. IP29b_bin.148]|uniref:ribosomal maturation YjgA family protein n=1 Tax=Acaryochloris sp. IP29b_bin.148 TaxID=2969218 RepID=UPI00262CCEC9|nr:DUF2809 domain-containing protein [Acaryochloris sp. IP29b_bin.148]
MSKRPAPLYRPYRQALAVSMAVIVPLGLTFKFYQGPGQSWLNDTFGGVPYEIFFVLLAAYIWPSVSPGRIAISVCLTTCGLEFLQLWQPAWLQAIRATLLGRLVLGNTFSWEDFPYYFVGSGLGWLGLRWLKRVTSHT